MGDFIVTGFPVIFGFSFLLLAIAYVTATVAYCAVKIKHRKYIILISERVEFFDENEQLIVIAARYRYGNLIRCVKLLKWVNVLSLCLFCWALVVTRAYPMSAGKLICLWGLAVNVFTLLYCVIQINVMKDKLEEFLHTYGFHGYNPEFVYAQTMLIKKDDKSKRSFDGENLQRLAGFNPVEKVVNLDSVVDRLIPHGFAENPTVRKYSKKLIGEIILKIVILAGGFAISYITAFMK